MSTVGEGFWGEPGNGKTSLAQQRMIERAGDRACPSIMLDIERNLRYPGAVEIRDVPPDRIIDPVWTDGNHIIYSPPRDPAMIEWFFEIVCNGGNVCLLVDEAHNVAKGEKASPALLHLCRIRRPQGIDIYFTSTQPQDLHATAWSVISSCFVFRTRSAFALDRLKRERGLTDAQIQAIRNLQPFEYIEC
jgi:hypothetical protein